MSRDHVVSRAEELEAEDLQVGAGSADTALVEGVEVPWLRRQPLVALAIALFLPTVAAFVTELAGNTDSLVAILLGGVGTLITVGTAIAWRHVTPVALPRIDSDPLVPLWTRREDGYAPPAVIFVLGAACLLLVLIAIRVF